MDKNNERAKTVDYSEGMNCKIGVPRFFSIADLMMSTGLSRSTINRQIKAGNIPTVRIGNRILIPRSYFETLQTAAEATTKGEK